MLCKLIKKEYVHKAAEPVYDLSVTDLHNFVLSNGAVVHNCDT
jgi:intein/homing endonuclease